MKPNPRASIAFIAGSLITQIQPSSIYDNSQGKHINISGDIQSDYVKIYDHDQGCYISGTGINGSYSLYHHGDGHNINLEIEGNSFRGTDSSTSCDFNGNINGNSISIYDRENGSNFEYDI